MRKKRLLWLIPVGVVGMLGFIALGGFLVMQLWNWLIPGLFGWHTIAFWQALALLVLCRILFGGFGGRGFGPRMGSQMRHRLNERWENMTPQERERFRQGLRGRCGFGAGTSEGQAQ